MFLNGLIGSIIFDLMILYYIISADIYVNKLKGYKIDILFYILYMLCKFALYSFIMIGA